MTEPETDFWNLFVNTFISTIGDVLPIAVILIGAQMFVLRRKVPHLRQLVAGFVMVLLGLAFFLIGLDLALFELGEKMAEQLTSPSFVGLDEGAGQVTVDWTHYLWLYLFAAALVHRCIISSKIRRQRAMILAMSALSVGPLSYLGPTPGR